MASITGGLRRATTNGTSRSIARPVTRRHSSAECRAADTSPTWIRPRSCPASSSSSRSAARRSMRSSAASIAKASRGTAGIPSAVSSSALGRAGAARAAERALQDVVDGERAGARHREPEKEREVEGLFEAEEILEGIDVAPLRRLDRDEHHDGERAGGDTRQKAGQQEQSAEKLHPGHDRREQLRKRNAPSVTEVLDDERQVMKLAPAGQHEDPADDDARDEGREPGEVARRALRPADETVDQRSHRSAPRFRGPNA